MLIDLPTAKLHLRVDGAAEDALITVMIGAAERDAVEFMSRRIFATDDALAQAVAMVPVSLAAATLDYESRLAAAALVANDIEREVALDGARSAYKAARVVARRTYQGIVLNDAIKAAMLLILAHLYANREAVYVGTGTPVEIPLGAKSFLWHFRVDLGV